MLKRMIFVTLFFAPWCVQGQEGVWRRFGEGSDSKGYQHNHSPRFSSHNFDVIKEEGSYGIPEGYKFAYGWESIRFLRVERIKGALEQGLREHLILFPDERIAFIKETWEEVKSRQSTRHLFAMDQFGRIRLLTEGGGSELIAKVSPKGAWRKLGGFLGKRVALPAAQAIGLSLVYTPVLRAIGGGVAVGVGGSSTAVGCHQEGGVIHCGAH